MSEYGSNVNVKRQVVAVVDTVLLWRAAASTWAPASPTALPDTSSDDRLRGLVSACWWHARVQGENTTAAFSCDAFPRATTHTHTHTHTHTNTYTWMRIRTHLQSRPRASSSGKSSCFSFMSASERLERTCTCECGGNGQAHVRERNRRVQITSALIHCHTHRRFQYAPSPTAPAARQGPARQGHESLRAPCFDRASGSEGCCSGQGRSTASRDPSRKSLAGMISTQTHTNLHIHTHPHTHTQVPLSARLRVETQFFGKSSSTTGRHVDSSHDASERSCIVRVKVRR
jgi:hypothetical protein